MSPIIACVMKKNPMAEIAPATMSPR